jgi:copper chaperone CopZ
MIVIQTNTKGEKIMKNITFKVDDFVCPTCVQKIEKVMPTQPGVHEVKVMFNAAKVKIQFDETIGNPEQYEDVLIKLGSDILSKKIS